MLFRIETMAKSCFNIWVDTIDADCARLANQAIARLNEEVEAVEKYLKGVMMNCTSNVLFNT